MHLIMKYFLFTESSYSKGWIRLSFKMLVFYKNTKTNDSDYTCFSIFIFFLLNKWLHWNISLFVFAVNLKRSVALHFALIFPLRWSFSWPFDKSPLLKAYMLGQLHKPEGCLYVSWFAFLPSGVIVLFLVSFVFQDAYFSAIWWSKHTWGYKEGTVCNQIYTSPLKGANRGCLPMQGGATEPDWWPALDLWEKQVF